MPLTSRVQEICDAALVTAYEAVEAAGRRAEATAKENVPVDTGALRDGIVWKHGAGRGLAGRLKSKDHKTMWIEFGTVHMAAQPFLRPARQAAREGFITDMERAYR